MLLRRWGGKQSIIDKLTSLFPDDITTFIDMFLGTGAVTFAMADKAKHVIANDLEKDVINLFLTLRHAPKALIKAIQIAPIHSELFQYWIKRKEKNAVWRAVRFLMLSNFSFLGQKTVTLAFGRHSSKKAILTQIEYTFEKIQNVCFMSKDFRLVFSKLERSVLNDPKTFVYADPPYYGTGSNYDSTGSGRKFMFDLFGILMASSLRVAISGFYSPFLLDLAKKHNLYVIILAKHKGISSSKVRKDELLFTNYKPEKAGGTDFPFLRDRRLL